MKFTIDGTVYEMAQSKVTFAEARAVEKVTGHTFNEINTSKEVQGSTDVIQAMIWVSMKRSNPTLLFSDLDDVAIDEIEWEADPEETEPDPTEAVPSNQDDAGTVEPETTSSESDSGI